MAALDQEGMAMYRSADLQFSNSRSFLGRARPAWRTGRPMFSVAGSGIKNQRYTISRNSSEAENPD